MGLRNLLERTPRGKLVLGTPFEGRLGSEIMAASIAGQNGPGPMANDSLVANRRYRLILEGFGTFPAGSLQIDELGRLAATAPGRITYRLLEGNLVSLGTPENRTIVVTIGVPAPPTPRVDPIYGCTVDCGVVFDNPAGQATFQVPHLAGKTVAVVADGSSLAQAIVDSAGAVTISRPGKRVLIGLPFVSELTLLTPEYQTGTGTAQAQASRTSELALRFLDTVGAVVRSSAGSEQAIPFRRFGAGILDKAPEPYTGLLRTTMLGWERGDIEISVIQRDPYPMHVLAAVRRHTTNG